MTEILKTCPGCGLEMTADQIINDPSIKPIGMSFLEIDSETPYYFFQHEVDNCGSCFVIKVDKLSSLIDEYIPAKSMKLSPSCSRHCTDIKSLEDCSNKCHNSPYRRFLLHMLEAKFPSRSINR